MHSFYLFIASLALFVYLSIFFYLCISVSLKHTHTRTHVLACLHSGHTAATPVTPCSNYYTVGYPAVTQLFNIMRSRLSLAVLLAVLCTTVLCTDFLYDKDETYTTNDSFIAQIVAGSSDDGYTRVCGDSSYTDDNLYVICIFLGYETYNQVTNTTGYNFDDQLYGSSYGWKELDCEDAATEEDCKYTVIGDHVCSMPLVVNCSSLWDGGTGSDGAEILPIVLIIATFSLIIAMCLMDRREKMQLRDMSIKKKTTLAKQVGAAWATNGEPSATVAEKKKYDLEPPQEV
eukprot:sb/3467696/